jgi:hypothetical protein
MTNSRAKGRRTELKAKIELEREGWLLEQAKPSQIWGKQNDLFSLFDFLGIKKVGDKQYLIWVQVKTNKKPSLEPFKKFKEEYCDEYNVVEVWIWHDYSRKGWEKIRI